MHELAESVKNEFDIILFDCTPLLGVSDAAIVSRLVDAILLVVQPGRFPRSMLRRVKNLLGGLGANVLGIVLNNVDTRYDEQYRFYTTYTDYYGKSAHGTNRVRKADVRRNVDAESSLAEDDY
jgi:Mrp family chromosome partitioning ATPase